MYRLQPSDYVRESRVAPEIGQELQRAQGALDFHFGDAIVAHIKSPLPRVHEDSVNSQRLPSVDPSQPACGASPNHLGQ
jgi:hypothetical protein